MQCVVIRAYCHIVHYSDWSSLGLGTAVESSHSVVCTSKHLTSFAVLVEINGPQVGHQGRYASDLYVKYASLKM